MEQRQQEGRHPVTQRVSVHVELVQCWKCGAAVMDASLHESWHRQQDMYSNMGHHEVEVGSRTYVWEPGLKQYVEKITPRQKSLWKTP